MAVTKENEAAFLPDETYTRIPTRELTASGRDDEARLRAPLVGLRDGRRQEARAKKQHQKWPDDDSSSDASSETTGTSATKIYGVTVQPDEDDATIVVVFPHSKARKGFEGVLDVKELVKEPRVQAEKIFQRMDNYESIHTLEKASSDLRNNVPMNTGRYHTEIRQLFIEVLEHCGVTAKQFMSVDKDETFLKIHLKQDGTVLEQMAETIEYYMPFSREAYRGVQAFGDFPGGQPMANAEGDAVLAYESFQVKHSHKFQPFRFVDVVRILEYWLHRWVSLEEMQRQGVVRLFFVSARHEEMNELYEQYASPRRLLSLPPISCRSLESMRDYFGEEFTLFLRFNAYLIRFMLAPTLFGLVYFSIKNSLLTTEQTEYVQFGFAVALATWSSILYQMNANASARLAQIWGVNDSAHLAMSSGNWDPKRTGQWRSILVNSTVLVYIALYVGAVILMNALLDEINKAGFASVSGLLVTLTIKVGQLAWGRIAPVLVNFENIKSKANETSKLAMILFMVNVFVVFWPFLSACFLQSYFKAQCANSLDAAVEKVWGTAPLGGWPSSALSVMDTYFSFKEDDLTCIKGCYPPDPFNTYVYSRTNCFETTRSTLRTFFGIQTLSDIVFMIIPIFLTKWAMYRDTAKLKKDEDGESEPYTVLQWQAKCAESSPYFYASWGGSLVEDFIAFYTGFALVICFSVITPVMIPIYVVFQLIGFRLKAFRMLYVTCRPFPRAAAGLGVFGDIFGYICLMSIFVNAGLVAYFLYPVRSWGSWWKLVVFVAVEHVSLFLRSSIDFIIPDTPADVVLADQYNEHVRHRFKHYDTLSIPPEERLKAAELDLSVDP